MRTALLVIDMQNDFIRHGASLEVKGIRKNIPALWKFIANCRAKGMLIVYTRHCYTPKGNPVQSRLFPHLAKKRSLMPGSAGWNIYAALQPEREDRIIDKTRYDAFFKSDLQSILQKKGVDTVIIAGTMTEVCCESTARTAMFLDYDVVFCSDLTFTSYPAMQQRTLKLMRSHFGKVISSRNILKNA